VGSVSAVDFGDAPAPYPVTLIEDGARHEATGPRLGADRDSESDGAHSAAADADDTTDVDDEDGVSFGFIRAGQLGASVTVNVQNAGGGAKLDAWVDFNGDGCWGGPFEQIADNVMVADGNNIIIFDVPSWAIDGQSYARLRLSTAGDLAPGGSADDGEVEDYQVTITTPAIASGFFGGPNVITTDANGAWSVFAADVDGDGDMDVLTASILDDTMAWYANDGSGYFTPYIITIAADGAESVFAADVDGDGDMDVLSASCKDDTIAWYENDGSENFTPHTITKDAVWARSVFAADVDGDGDMDVLSASGGDDKIAWYDNDGSENFTPHTITEDAHGAHSVFAADVDGDGDMDVLSASIDDSKIAWYANGGSENFTAHTITIDDVKSRSVFAADLDGDGDMDVLSASGHDGVTWYANDGSETFTAHTITTDVNDAWSIFAADVDGDGDMDALSASLYDNKIAWYKNDGSGNFTAHTIATDANRARSVFAADVDGDGDLDVLSASWWDDKIAWYENPRRFDFGDAPAPYPTTLSEDGAQHEAIGPRLGVDRDFESDGTHSATADADDTNGIDDEDGVSFGTIQTGRLGASVTVNVQNDPNAKLDAWVDFNGDGCWGGPFEQIADNVTVADGNNIIHFDVPSWAIDGQSYGRFRLSTAGDLAPGGLADDGEVEDYQVTITAPAPASGVFGSENVITDEASGAHSVFAADLDGDGDLDALSASLYDNKIAWYKNDGNDNFTAHTIATVAGGAKEVFAADVDGDGDVDVLSASGDNRIAWYDNDGSGSFTPYTIATAPYGPESVFAADVDGDGDTDVLSASWWDDTIAWYANNGSENFTPHIITMAADGAESVFAADVDSDGDMDVLSASSRDSNIAWYENNGSEGFTPHIITTDVPSAQSVFAADVDGDGDMDVLSASGSDGIAWYANDGNESFTPHNIGGAGWSASVFAGDVDGDGDMDVLSTSSPAVIAWYANDGSGNFSFHVVFRYAGNANSVFAGDVDGDGDLDVLSACGTDNTIAWYENLAVDFGDAPAPYPTMLSENGARHTATGPRLGSDRDIESDGAHSAAADADDTNDIDDEDGVSFGFIRAGQLGASVTVNVQNDPNAKLDAWIDFNGDGDWNDPLEQIADNVLLINGDNIVSFDVPSWATEGQSYGRFRLSTAGGLAPDGAAADGEVEDYVVAIAAYCVVDYEDLGYFVEEWLVSGDVGANFDWDDNPVADNRVDLYDLSYLASYWMMWCPEDWPWQ
jgi:hypothetical protein